MNIWKWTTLALAGVLAVVVGWGQLVRPAAAGEKQLHMRSALVNLKAAKGQLEKASADKGGHRVKAIELTQQAIDEVDKGIEAGGD
jgi:hypothetical protein